MSDNCGSRTEKGKSYLLSFHPSSSVILSFPSLPAPPLQAAKNAYGSPEAALETTELMELLVQEPNANTAIKCPTDLFTVQTPPPTATHRDVDVNIQHTSVMDACM